MSEPLMPEEKPEVRQRPPFLAIALPALVVAMGCMAVLGGYMAAQKSLERPTDVAAPEILSGGNAVHAVAVSKGGAVAWVTGDGERWRLLYQEGEALGQGEPQVLVESTEKIERPVFSVNSEPIVYLHGGDVEAVAPTAVPPDSTPEKLFSCPDGWQIRQVAWAANGDLILVTRENVPGSPFRIERVDPAGGERWALTEPSVAPGDISLALSPSGEFLAFVRRGLDNRSDLMVHKLETGETRARTQLPDHVEEVAWTADGNAFLFDGEDGVYRLPRKGGDARREVEAPLDTRLESPVDFKGNVLALQTTSASALWRLDSDNVERPQRLHEPAGMAYLPRISANGERIAFALRRRGGSEIWAINTDGSEPRRLTRLGATRAVALTWFGDAVLVALRDGRLLKIEPRGIRRQRLPTETPMAPFFTHDGQGVVYSTGEAGSGDPMELMLYNLETSTSEPLGKQGWQARPAPDGSLYFRRAGEPGLLGPDGSAVLQAADWLDWRMTGDGIYAVGRDGALRYQAWGGEPAKLVAPGPLNAESFDPALGERWLVVVRSERTASDLVLAEPAELVSN